MRNDNERETRGQQRFHASISHGWIVILWCWLIDGGFDARWSAGAIYLFYLGWLWTGIGDLDGLVGRQPPGVPLDVDAGVHSGLLRLPYPSSFSAASSSRVQHPEVPRVTPGPHLGPNSYTGNPQFLTWNENRTLLTTFPPWERRNRTGKEGFLINWKGISWFRV